MLFNIEFSFKPYIELIQGLSIGEVLTHATKRKIPSYDRWLNGKESACHCRSHRRHGLDPWVGRSPGEGDGNPLQYSCLMDESHGAWHAIVHGVTGRWTQLSRHTHIYDHIPEYCVELSHVQTSSEPHLCICT